MHDTVLRHYHLIQKVPIALNEYFEKPNKSTM